MVDLVGENRTKQLPMVGLRQNETPAVCARDYLIWCAKLHMRSEDPLISLTKNEQKYLPMVGRRQKGRPRSNQRRTVLIWCSKLHTRAMTVDLAPDRISYFQINSRNLKLFVDVM
jgi:hypothetical protein